MPCCSEHLLQSCEWRQRTFKPQPPDCLLPSHCGSCWNSPSIPLESGDKHPVRKPQQREIVHCGPFISGKPLSQNSTPGAKDCPQRAGITMHGPRQEQEYPTQPRDQCCCWRSHTACTAHKARLYSCEPGVHPWGYVWLLTLHVNLTGPQCTWYLARRHSGCVCEGVSGWD